MDNILATPEKIREVLKNWIDETDNETIERVFNENFDDEIWYDVLVGLFQIPIEEAKRLGLDL